MRMPFFWISSWCYQQAAGHSQMDDNLIAAFKPDYQELSPSRHSVNDLSRKAAAKFIGGRVGNHFRASDSNLFNRKPLYMRFDHPPYGFHFW